MTHLLPATAPMDGPNGHSTISAVTTVEDLVPPAAPVDLAPELVGVRNDLALARAEIERLHRLRQARESELADFKDTVARVAMRYAREHDWCSVVTDALAELGLTPPEIQVSGTFTVTYEFIGTLAHSLRADLTESWVASSIDLSDDGAPRLDSDWDDVTITPGTARIEYYAIDED